MFTSDGSTESSGWSADYRSGYCSGQSTETAASGSIEDGSGGNDYGPNASCSWLLTPTGASTVTLEFTAFSLENGNDSVKVYDGATTGSTLLGAFTGTSLPGQITSTGGELLVVFTSDGSTESSGWSANYSSTEVVFCPDSLWIADTPMDSDTFQASAYLESDGVVSADSQVVFLADIIVLTPGFHAQEGSDFHAIPVGCVDLLPGIDARAVAENLHEETDNEEIRLECYPNPFSEQTNIIIQLDQDLTIDLFVADFSGRVSRYLVRGELRRKGEHRFTLDGNDMKSGFYVLVISTSDGQRKVKKLVLL